MYGGPQSGHSKIGPQGQTIKGPFGPNMSIDLKLYRWVLLGGIWAIYFCFGLIIVSMAPLIPVIASELDISNGTMGAILGTWPLVYIVSAIPCGILLDKLSPRLALLLATVFMAASVLLRGLAPDQLTLFLAVGVFGLGGPLISVGAPKYAARWFQGQHRGFAIGFCTTGPVLGSAVALAITPSWLMSLMGDEWRQVMFVFAGLTLAVGGLWWIIASHPFALESDEVEASHSSFSGRVILQIITNPAVLVMLVMGAGVFFINHSIINWLPEILRSKGLSATQSGLWASAATVIGIAGLLVVPRLAIPQRRLLILMAIFVTMSVASVLLLSPSLQILPVGLLLIGLTRMPATGIVLLLLMETPGVDSKHHGLLGGIFFVGAEIGGALGPLSIGLLSNSSGDFGSSLWALAGVNAALFALTLGLLLFAKRSS